MYMTHNVYYSDERLARNSSTAANYVLSLSFMDQMTWAAARLRSLQCWAGHLDRLTYTVEPFVVGTQLRAPINENMTKNPTLMEMFDINEWNKCDEEHYLSPLVTWNNFLMNASRRLILVQIVYDTSNQCPENKLSKDKCDLVDLKTFWLETLEPHSFIISREVCINFQHSKFISIETFNAMVFGDLLDNPSATHYTVVFDEWRGGHPMHRTGMKCFLKIKDTCSPLALKKAAISALNLSSRINSKADIYITNYLNEKSGYVAVMVRWEQILLYGFYRKGEPNYSGAECLKLIENYLNEVQDEKGLLSTFISTDIGKYGSSTFQLYSSTREHNLNVTNYTKWLLQTFHSVSLDQYERRFEEISGTNNSAYIAQIQKVIVARATCLLLVGTGSFQEHTQRLYEQLHKSNSCLKVIEKC